MLHGSFVKTSFSGNRPKATADHLSTITSDGYSRDGKVDYFVRRLWIFSFEQSANARSVRHWK
jgi:hypothetical protein